MQVTFIGAGSATFSLHFMSDILAYPEFRGCTFSLMDIDPKALRIATMLAHNVADTLGARIQIRAGTDRRRALEGADFVLVTIRVGGDSLIRLDKEIPRRYGLVQTVADTVGIGGIFYGLRHMPIVVGVARDMEQICPNALLLNYTNPMAMNTLAALRATRIQTVGLCHSVQGTLGRLRLFASLSRLSKREIRSLLGDNKYPICWPYFPPKLRRFMRHSPKMIPSDEWHGMCAGINHLSPFLKLAWRDQDAYPMIWAAAGRPEITALEPTRFEMLRRLGYFITESSFHLSEYVPHVMRHPEEVRRLRVFQRPPLDKESKRDAIGRDALYRRILRKERLVEPGRPISDEYASRIIHAVVTGRPQVVNGNVHNRGGKVISNLPEDCCVEVPCVVNRFGVQPTTVGDLPPQMAALIRTNISVQDLAVRAVLEENREHVYHAAMMDPNTAATLTLPKIWQLVDELLAVHAKYIPRGLRQKRIRP